jgi:hypothetical protein
MTNLYFTKNAKKEILNIFNKSIDSDDYIIDNQNKEKVLSIDGKEITISEFAGIKKGSEIFISNNTCSIIKNKNKF